MDGTKLPASEQKLPTSGDVLATKISTQTVSSALRRYFIGTKTKTSNSSKTAADLTPSANNNNTDIRPNHVHFHGKIVVNPPEESSRNPLGDIHSEEAGHVTVDSTRVEIVPSESNNHQNNNVNNNSSNRNKKKRKTKPRNRPSFRIFSAALSSYTARRNSKDAGDESSDSSETDNEEDDVGYRQIDAAVVALPPSIVAFPAFASITSSNNNNDGQQHHHSHNHHHHNAVRPRLQLALQRLQTWPDKSASTFCPMCRSTIETTLRYRAGKFSIILSGILASTGVGLFGCFVFPFCCQYCLDVRHHCPVCNELLGIHVRRFPQSLSHFRCIV